MNKIVYRYPLQISDFQEVSLPIGAEILTVQTQEEVPYIFALVNQNELEHEARHFEMFATGVPIHYDMGVSRTYLATIQLPEFGYVFHIFEYTGV